MIEENKRNNIHDELEKSSEIMQEAELLDKIRGYLTEKGYL